MFYNMLDPLLIETFRAQPLELSPLQAIRNAFGAVFQGLPEDELAQQRDRATMFLSVPELRTAWMGELGKTIQMTEGIIAERLGRPTGDFAVRNFAGAVLGVALVAMLYGLEHPQVDLFEAIDAGFAHLEAGLPL